MCWFKKKKTPVIEGNKFSVNQDITFRYRGSMSPGIVYAIKLGENNEILYDIQIGGECPAIIENVKEDELHERIKRRIA